MRPHEETWEAIFPYEDPDGGTWEVVIAGTETLRADVVYEHDARLMAQAPAMARLLLSLQWVGTHWDRSGGTACCPSCRANRGRGGVESKHAADCELAAVLRAAGAQ